MFEDLVEESNLARVEESEGGVDLELAGSLLENMSGVASQRHHQLVQHLKALKDGVIGIICQETFDFWATSGSDSALLWHCLFSAS